jgi:hypothetical protein
MGLTIVEIEIAPTLRYGIECPVFSLKTKLLTNQSGGTSVDLEVDLHFEACLYHTSCYAGSEYEFYPHQYLGFALSWTISSCEKKTALT